LALKKGSQRITLRPDGPPQQALVDLRGLILVAQGTPLPPRSAAAKSAGPAKSAAELARDLLHDEKPAKVREAIVAEHPDLAAELIAAMAAGLDSADEAEQYRRIPWIWRVAIAAGRRAEAAQLKSLLDASLPRDGKPLADWQAVVIGGGVINGVSQTGRWPDEFIGQLLKDDKALMARWSRAIELSSAMADDPKVRGGTRYDALRMVAMDGWQQHGEQLQKYLAQGVNDELQMGAVSGAADVRSPEAGPVLAAGLGYYSPRNRELALDALLRDESRLAALLDALAAGKVSKEMLGEARIAKLLKAKDATIRKRAEQLLGL
jgi:hypothetical protein